VWPIWRDVVGVQLGDFVAVWLDRAVVGRPKHAAAHRDEERAGQAAMVLAKLFFDLVLLVDFS
jgi:hypothetical protein